MSNDIQVETHRGHTILLDKETTKFSVREAAEIEPVDSIQAAKKAIDRRIADLNKGVRRKVLTFSDDYYSRRIVPGELTSWSRARGYRNTIQGVVSYGKEGHELRNPDDIFEDTPENRALMERVLELDKRIVEIRKETDDIIENKLQKAAMPEHLTKGKA